jgi:hypothetical protein
MKRSKSSGRITPESLKNAPPAPIDEEALDLELAELRHKARQKQGLPARVDHKHEDGRHEEDRHHKDDFHAPGAVDLDPRALQETREHHKRGVIDLHPHEVEEHDPHLPRSLQSKLFGIGPSGYFQLTVLCIAVGAVLEAGGFNPFDPGFTWQAALSGIGSGALNVLGWVINAGWKPMLIGAAITLPIWLVWRLLSVPFRR